MIVKKIKNKWKFSGGLKVVRPELLKLLTTLRKIFKKEVSCIEKKRSMLKKNTAKRIKISSWCFLKMFLLDKIL